MMSPPTCRPTRPPRLEVAVTFTADQLAAMTAGGSRVGHQAAHGARRRLRCRWPRRRTPGPRPGQSANRCWPGRSTLHVDETEVAYFAAVAGGKKNRA